MKCAVVKSIAIGIGGNPMKGGPAKGCLLTINHFNWNYPG